ncbi:hypothetical protein [Serinicoccus sediminis]|uniref:hypothetical protein n=1 Tax=Serinicoccus sediminis TaxID=2306021 RepID=UPI0010222ACC|nr:hypothetical protein [Serinicoccus sediminis]
MTEAELKGSADVRSAVAAAAGLGDTPVRSEQWRDVIPRLHDVARAEADRHHGSSCSRCGAPIVWGETDAGKTMPLDPLPCPGSGNVIRVPSGRRMLLRVLGPSALPVVGRTAYRCHFATCPNADQLRARRDSRPDGAKPCPVCRYRMDPWLRENNYPAHPGCMDDFEARGATTDQEGSA